MSDADAQAEIEPILLETFRAYVTRREQWYRKPKTILDALLKKDVLLFALRGAATSGDFVDHAFTAFESSSEETMWGNAWQEGIAKAAPHTVGGGDLRTERDGTLWVIQLKMGTQNANAMAQDLRTLKAKVAQELDHHPGRKQVKAMYAIIRGPAQNQWRHYRDRSAANRDIDGFQYQYMVGSEFRRWVGTDFAAPDLASALSPASARVAAARAIAIRDVKAMLRDRLEAAGLDDSIVSVMRLADIPHKT